MFSPSPPDSSPFDLELRDRPVCGRDVLFFQQWFNTTLAETCYLFGLSLPRWQQIAEQPDAPVGDPAVALLLWALATYPETRFLPAFPAPVEVYPLFRSVAVQSTGTMARHRQTHLGKTAFGLMLGREITSMNRWSSETRSRPPGPQIDRLLFVLRNILLTYGVTGFDAWLERVTLEAEARDLVFSSRMTSWSRMIEARPGRPAHGKAQLSPKPRVAVAQRPAGRLALADPAMVGLRHRPVDGNDLMLLQQWTGASIAECCYLLGITVSRWHEYRLHPDRLLGDVSVSLLTWALLTYPEAHYLPIFPDPAAVYPGYMHAVRHGGAALPDPDTAFSLLLGRERAATARWRAGCCTRHSLQPPVRRLLLVLQTLLTTRGVPGFDTLVDRARLEATARGFDLDSPAMTTWARRAPYRPRRAGARRSPGRPPKHKDPPNLMPAPEN